jgi:hypothetical protein
VVIEVLGMSGNADYDARIAEKRAHYLASGIPLLEWDVKAGPAASVRLPTATEAMTAPDIASAALVDREYARALDLVQRFRAASVALLQRHCRLAPMLPIAAAHVETTLSRMPDGLYLFVGEIIGNELQAFHGFAREVLTAITVGRIDAEQLRAAADRYGITPQVLTSLPPR